MQFATKLVCNRGSFDPVTGAAGVPLYLASTYQQDVDQPGAYDYARSGNPTRHALEEVIVELEGGEAGFAFSSGMAAIATVLLGFSGGDHLIVSEDVYGGTYRLVRQVLPRFGVEVTFVDTTCTATIEKALRPHTKAIFVETPSNPFLKVTDLKAVVQLAKRHGLITIADNTFLTPYYQRPLACGVDLVVHSATKFLAGHSDVVAGLVVSNHREWTEKIAFLQNALGAVLGVPDTWLVLRGMRTLKARLDMAAAHASYLAQWLQEQPWVEAVYYPGLASHPGHDIHQKQASGAGAVLSFTVKRKEQALALLRNIQIPLVAVSLGAVETIVSYPVAMSHAAMPEEERLRRGIDERLLRMSVGLEDPEDIIRDFNQALNGGRAPLSRSQVTENS